MTEAARIMSARDEVIVYALHAASIVKRRGVKAPGTMKSDQTN